MLVLAMLMAAVACNGVLDPTEEVVDLQLTPGDVTLTVGSSAYLTATGLNADGVSLEGDVTWTSSDIGVVTVTEAGLLTAVAIGQASVQAEFKGKGNAYGRQKKSTKVKVEEPVDPQIPPGEDPLPPTEDPPAEDPPAEDPPAEDPPQAGDVLIGASRFDVTSDYPFTMSPQHRVHAGDERDELEPLRVYGKYAVINLTGGKSNYKNPDETFNVDMWKAIVDGFDVAVIQEYVDAGWVIAHYVLDEPHAGSQWSGEDVDPALVDEAACYSKSKWPNLPTIIRTHPGWAVREEGAAHQFQCVDSWVAQYSARKGPIEEYVAQNIADAEALGASVGGALNPITGGDGSSGVRSTYDPDKWMMSGDEIRTYGAAWLAAPIDLLGFWKWSGMEWYWEQPEIRAAVEYLAGQ